MKNSITLCLLALIFASCNSDNKLDSKTALQLIQKEKNYPKVVEYEIYTADPEEAKRLLDLGLEKEGLVTVQRTQASKDIGQPLITFTTKAKPYLLTQTDEDKQSKVQRVKIADEVVNAITKMDTEQDGKSAMVEFETSFKNITPFSVLINLKLEKERINKAYFKIYGNEWHLTKQINF